VVLASTEATSDVWLFSWHQWSGRPPSRAPSHGPPTARIPFYLWRSRSVTGWPTPASTAPGTAWDRARHDGQLTWGSRSVEGPSRRRV